MYEYMCVYCTYTYVVGSIYICMHVVGRHGEILLSIYDIIYILVYIIYILYIHIMYIYIYI